MFWITRIASIAAAVGVSFLIQMLVLQQNNSLITTLASLSLLYVTLSVSLNLINGITGQFSIGHAAFYMVGAYTAGFLANILVRDWPVSEPVKMFFLIVVSALAAALAGFVVGLPSLRLRGDYLAVVTLGFGEILRIIAQNIPAIGGSHGLTVKKLQDGQEFSQIWMIALLAILCIAVCRNLLKSAHGLQFLAVREDEIASSAMGVNVTRVKVMAFVIGSAFAGAAGALYGIRQGFVSPKSFPMELSFTILTMVVLGGTGSITGAALAGALLYFLPEQLRNMPPISGASLLAAILAIVAAVIMVKRIADHYHGQKLMKSGLYIGALIAAMLLKLGLGMAFGGIKPLTGATFEADKLRMVIFAATLIILMLIRPQGVFAHHEFSWDLLKRWFGKRKQTEVAA